MLAHLTLMIRTASIFPIVGSGNSPMRPVDAGDVAAAVLAALRTPSSVGETFDVVGPERLTLRAVVSRVAEAMRLPVAICSTSAGLMRAPVWIMEKTMRQPLSTTAQLAMLREGLDGNPEPARRGLSLETAPFTAQRIRPLVDSGSRVLGLDLRLFSSPRPRAETTPALFILVLVFLVMSLSVVFAWVADVWMGLTVAMGSALVIALASRPARRFSLSVFNMAAGVGAGLFLYGLTRLVAWVLPSLWPGWENGAQALYLWQRGHSWLFLAPTLVMIIIAEEVAWRGVIARFFMERWGKALGIVAAASVYALAHWAAFNPLLAIAAFGCGLFWGWLYAASDDLAPPVVSHLIWDTLLLSFPLVGGVG
jgi:membrane protease YdiL (CAAX protease family)